MCTLLCFLSFINAVHWLLSKQACQEFELPCPKHLTVAVTILCPQSYNVEPETETSSARRDREWPSYARVRFLIFYAGVIYGHIQIAKIIHAALKAPSPHVLCLHTKSRKVAITCLNASLNLTTLASCNWRVKSPQCISTLPKTNSCRCWKVGCVMKLKARNLC